MPLSAYQLALANLKPHALQEVERAFLAWSTDATLGQVQQNVSDEAALTTNDFTSLLNYFAAQLANGKSPIDSWLTACRAHNCRAHKLKGRIIPDENCPTILGRAKGLDDHASSVAKASRGDLTKEQAKKLLLKHSDSLNLIGFEAFLRDAPLGNYLVWATFDLSDPRANPFDRLPHVRAGICTALGLGHFTPDDTLIILVWNHVDSGSPPLHRPTVADAEVYPYYRPRPEADAPWGLTKPLPPNPDGLQPQPEVVMPETTGKGLRLPFRVVLA
nr:hypothetical protein [Rhodoferax sp.]